MTTMSDKRYLGLDIGGTKSAVILGTEAGEVLQRLEWASEAHLGPQHMISAACAHATEIAKGQSAFAGIGVSIGGPVDADKGIVHSPPNLPDWDGIPLKSILQDHFGASVNIEHDAAACALAEYLWGIPDKPCRLIYLTCATGFGAGMVFDGIPYYGVHGRSPEIGHVLLDPSGPEAFGVRGGAEAFCSARSLGRLALWRFPERWSSPPEPSEINALWRQGDADAAWIIEKNAGMTGRCCALLGDLLHPDHIALGSLARYLGEPWIKLVREHFAELALPDVAAHCSVAATALGDRLQDLSAIAAATRCPAM